jgi:hypothetical protein
MFAVTNMQAQIKFGPEVGLNLSTMTFKSFGIAYDPKTLVGFNVGLNVGAGIEIANVVSSL